MTVKTCLFTCSGLFTNLGAAGGAAAQITSVMRGDDGMQDQAMYVFERDQDDGAKAAANGNGHENGNGNGTGYGYENGNGNQYYEANGNGYRQDGTPRYADGAHFGNMFPRTPTNGSYEMNSPDGARFSPPAVRSDFAFGSPPWRVDNRGGRYPQY
eukprot:3629225-Rhodomonas_salina.1